MDCSKTVDFFHEVNRMCDAIGDCSNCELRMSSFVCVVYDGREVNEQAVDIVQRWSDEHPEPTKKTYADYCIERFPNCAKSAEGTPFSCRAYLFGEEKTKQKCALSSFNCAKCWQEPLPDEYS